MAFAAAVQVSDDRGKAVAFASVPQRIVSLLPSHTEAVCALGACGQLVGVDRYSNFPPGVEKLPRVGGGLDPNIEAIVALKPDLVLIATSARAAERLEALGLRVLAMEPKTHAELRRTLEVLGQVLQVPDPQALWRQLDAGLDAERKALAARLALRKATRDPSRPVRVFVQVSPLPHGASEASFIGETLQRLGVANIVPAALGVFPQLAPEFVVRADPDLIFVGRDQADAMVNRPGWAQMRAVREGHVCRLTPAQRDVIARPSPRLVEAARLMADCVAGQAAR